MVGMQEGAVFRVIEKPLVQGGSFASLTQLPRAAPSRHGKFLILGILLQSSIFLYVVEVPQRMKRPKKLQHLEPALVHWLCHLSLALAPELNVTWRAERMHSHAKPQGPPCHDQVA